MSDGGSHAHSLPPLLIFSVPQTVQLCFQDLAFSEDTLGLSLRHADRIDICQRKQPAQRTGNTGLAPQTIATPDGLYNSQAGLEHLNLDINLRGRQQANSEWRKSGRDSSCFFPPLDMVQDAVVGTAGLALPKNAKKEYGKACEVLADNKNDEAENICAKPSNCSQNYVASWVLLGQVLEQRPDLAGAEDACQHAIAADDKYVQAYLCPADVAGRRGEVKLIRKAAGNANQSHLVPTRFRVII